jgi:ABC-type multidrug transport system fused ATPase/permease subunit
LQPTPKEAEELFDRIAEEVGTTESGEIPYEKLYSSSLSTFLRDSQIFGIVSRFKQEGKQKGIDRDAFVEFYPIFLKEVIHSDFRSTVLGSNKELESEETGGLDVAFENLCLTVKVGKKEVNVVDNVTGRLRSNTMTAVMGGSGSGKSSLLNALCGRAFYGRVTGTVTINGNDTLIEEHKAVIGFVPQDDIVYADLTVKENLLYAGRLQLPATKEEEIAELAEVTMASLGLSRIANSLVGDATRRGVSGG